MFTHLFLPSYCAALFLSSKLMSLGQWVSSELWGPLSWHVLGRTWLCLKNPQFWGFGMSLRKTITLESARMPHPRHTRPRPCGGPWAKGCRWGWRDLAGPCGMPELRCWCIWLLCLNWSWEKDPSETMWCLFRLTWAGALLICRVWIPWFLDFLWYLQYLCELTESQQASGKKARMVLRLK